MYFHLTGPGFLVYNAFNRTLIEFSYGDERQNVLLEGFNIIDREIELFPENSKLYMFEVHIFSLLTM